MKNIKKIFVAFLGLMFIFSCTETSVGLMDTVDSTKKDTEAMFRDSIYAIYAHTSIYTLLGVIEEVPNGVLAPSADFLSYEGATDNSRHVYVQPSEYYYAYTTATFPGNANYTRFKNIWDILYMGIQRCNTFLKYHVNAPLSDSRKESMATEARFIRAFYYYNLLRLFGGVPLLGDELLDIYGDHRIPRSTFEETVDSIAVELKAVAEMLPKEQTGIDYGRPTRGTALAVLGALYVEAASPLHNGGNVGSGTNRALVGYEDYQVDRWQKAVTALEEMMALNTHDLVVDNTTRPGNGFYLATSTRLNSERVWFWLLPNNTQYPNKRLLPKTRGGETRQVPYHELVQAFPMKNGKQITDPSSGYDAIDPYINRDPRFGFTFIYNKALWQKAVGGVPVEVDTYRGSGDDAIFTGTATGYYYRKGFSENLLGGTNNTEANGANFIRYVDVLLMHAEALTELNFDANKTKVDEQLFKIRERAGIEAGADGRYGIPSDLNKETMIDFIINERRIELASEAGNRFWDLKRRKLFENLDGVWTSAAVWEVDGSYVVRPMQLHSFDAPKMYFNAIPLSQINASAGSLIQNPGW